MLLHQLYDVPFLYKKKKEKKIEESILNKDSRLTLAKIGEGHNVYPSTVSKRLEVIALVLRLIISIEFNLQKSGKKL